MIANIQNDEGGIPGNDACSALSLVVTADDFGIGVETSAGIIKSHLHGPVTATSLMSITGDHARASVQLLAEAPNLDVGLHLVLTRCGEKPAVARRSSGLVDREGAFFSNGKLWARAFAGKLDRLAIADEIVAQTDLFYKLMGRLPDYVDGHHHAHQLPTVQDALLDVIERDLLPPVTRITREPPGMAWKVGAVPIKRAAARWLGKRAAAAFSHRLVWTNDSFFGMLAPGDLGRVFPWSSYLAALPATGVVEWVVHPGLPDETLKGRDDYDAARSTELNALTGASGVAAWQHLRPNLARKSMLRPKPIALQIS